jgi:hypothetical protein
MQHLKEVDSQFCSLFLSFSFHTQFPEIIFQEVTVKYKILTVSPSATYQDSPSMTVFESAPFITRAHILTSNW